MLRFPRAFWLAALLAMTLGLPSLFADFYCDDQGILLRLEGAAPAPIPGPFFLYTFASGEPGEQRVLVDHGLLPWWTIDGLRLSFCRPLSSALLALDHALAGRHPLPYHLHSIVWYVAAVVVAAILLRRILPEREAAAAALLFAASPAHWMLVAWPSARHVAVSGFFAIVAIAIHLRARQRQGAHALLASLAALASAALALAAGEAALGVFAYVAAYEAIGRRDPIAARLRALAPWGALLLSYAALYQWFGFGVRGSGTYVDPIAQPADYLALLPSRLAVYADSALFGVPSELSTLAPRAIPVLAGMGVGAVLVLALLLRRVFRTAGPEDKRTLAWLLTGAAFATLPGAAGIPGDRILFLPNLGIIAALAVVLLRAGSKGSGTPLATVAARAGVALFAIVHVVLAPLSFAFGAAQLASTSHAAMVAASTAEIPWRDDVTVVGIGLSDPLLGMYLPSLLTMAHREPGPRAAHVLSMSSHDHRVRRTEDRTIEIAIVDGAMLEAPLECVVRSPQAPLRAGDVVPLGAWTVRILDESAGRPTRFSVTFDRSVDDASIALVVWKNGALRALAPPAVGQEVLVKYELGPMGI